METLICLDCGEILDHCQCEEKHEAPVAVPFSPQDLDCGPFENAKEAYLWMQEFSGNISRQLNRDPNFHRQKRESEVIAGFFDANHSIHLAAVRCMSVCKYTLKSVSKVRGNSWGPITYPPVNNDVNSETFEEDFKAQLSARGHKFTPAGELVDRFTEVWIVDLCAEDDYRFKDAEFFSNQESALEYIEAVKSQNYGMVVDGGPYNITADKIKTVELALERLAETYGG